MILYIQGRVGSWYGTRWDGYDPAYYCGDTYFKEGCDMPVPFCAGGIAPTMFLTKQEMIAAAEAMGFTVLEPPPRPTIRR